jgi:hypothetical protein
VEEHADHGLQGPGVVPLEERGPLAHLLRRHRIVDALKGVDAHDAEDPAGEEEGRLDGDGAAEGIAEDDDLPDLLGVDRGLDVGAEFGDAPFRPVDARLAVAGEIDGDRPVAGGERPELAVPEGAVGQPAVDEDEGRLALPGGRIDDLDSVRRGARLALDLDAHGLFLHSPMPPRPR